MEENHYQGRSKRQQRNNEMIAAVCIIGFTLLSFMLLIYKLSQLF